MQSNNRQSRKSRWGKSFAALESTEFRWLLASNAAFFLAMNGQMLTRSYLAWEITQQEMSLAYINAAFAIPMLFFSFVGGALTDRFERRRLIMIGQATLIVNEIIILILLIFDALAFGHLIAAGIVGGIMIPIIMPARTAIVYNTAGVRRLGNAMALGSGVMNISRVLGPALMGWIISIASPVGAYAIASVLFITAFSCLFGISKKPVNQSARHVSSIETPIETLQQSSNPNLQEFEEIKPRPGVFADILSGLRYIRSNPAVFTCLIFGFFPLALALPFQNLLILFADDVWQVGEQGLGTMMAVAGLGGLLGSIWVASRGESDKRQKMMVRNVLWFAVFLIIFSFSRNFYWALVALLIANTCVVSALTLNNTTLQLLTHDKHRGRVSSFMMLTFGVAPLCVFPLAWAAQHVGIAKTIAGASVILIIAMLAVYALNPYMRQLDKQVKLQLKKRRC